MNIALLTDGIHPYVIGGMQKHSLLLVRYLVKEKHTVYLFHCNESNYDITQLEFFSAEEKQYIKSYVIPFPHKSYFPFHYIYESYQYSKLINNSLKNVIKEIDFVFAQGFCAWDLLKNKTAPNPLKRVKETPPVAVHFHGLEMFQVIPSIKAQISKYSLREAVKFNVSKADYSISYGGKITGILEKITSKEKIWEIPAGIDGTWFQTNTSNGKEIRFVFLGRYERRKGVIELNSAIKNLLSAGGFTFDFIGPIPDEHKINSPQINYHGKISSETEIQNILTQSDVLVCPSYSEGMPNVIMEAMACGLAVIATDVGAVSLLVNNENGWLLEKPEIQAITNAMKNAIEIKGEKLEQKKRNSVSKIKRFMIDDVMKVLLQKIEAAVGMTSNRRNKQERCSGGGKWKW